MPAPDAERFDRLAPTYDQAVPFFATLGERLVDWVQPQPGQRVLDIGAGRGAVTVALSRLLGPGCDVVAGDVSTEMLARLRALHLPGVVARYLDTTALAEADNSFDVVFSAFVFHFLAGAPAALAEVARVLRPDGVFAMSVPGESTDGGWWARYEQIIAEFNARLNRQMSATATERRWDERAAEAGLRVAERTNVEVALPVDGPEGHWRWLLAHSHRGLFDALDAAGQVELHERVLRSLQEEHPAQGTRLIMGADFFQMTTA